MSDPYLLIQIEYPVEYPALPAIIGPEAEELRALIAIALDEADGFSTLEAEWFSSEPFCLD